MKCMLLSAVYQNRQAVLKFYEPKSNKLILLTDKTNHKPHCYVEPETANQIKEFVGVNSIEYVDVYDVVKDYPRTMAKVICSDPLVIGGKPDSLREMCKTWESDIKYYLTYLYDKGLVIGKWYNLSKDGNIQVLPSQQEIFDLSNIDMGSVIDTDKFEEYLKIWSSLLSEPIPEIKRMAFDIEIETTDKLPEPTVADQRITAISFCASDGLKKCFVLNRQEIPRGDVDKDKEYELVWYDSEKELIEASFELIENYPVILTYNGDMFDMPYMYNRALRLGIENIPLHMMKQKATLREGIHIDLYGVFSNRSLKNYAFNAKYVENSLDAVSEAMINERKTEYDGKLSEIPLHLLAKYCFNDSRLTYKLSSYNNNLVTNLLIMLCRIGNMPIDDLSRLGINNWIKSMLYFNHRQHNELIPRSDDFPVVESSTKALIKGKKYQGAIVLEQEKGIHFDVTVMDFASLYTSIVKTNNISYETVCCPHEECKSNKIPQTEHWSCTKKSGVLALMLGSLKELRVNHYKKLMRSAKTDEEKETYDMITQALKVYLNASYGVIGFENFPLYSLPTAEAITAIARDTLLKTIEAAKTKGMYILAGDTDSIFIKQPTKEQIDYLIDFAKRNHDIDLEIDKEYRYLVLSGRKKNYFGVKKDGKLDIKGLVGKKSNTPPFARELFTGVLDELKTITKPEQFDPMKKKISIMIKEIYENFDDIPLEKLTFKVLINKEPSEYIKKPQALIAAEQLPIKPEKGQFVEFIKTWKDIKVIPISLVKRNEIDKVKYIESLETVMEQVVEPMDIDIDLLLGRGKQTTLD